MRKFLILCHTKNSSQQRDTNESVPKNDNVNHVMRLKCLKDKFILCICDEDRNKFKLLDKRQKKKISCYTKTREHNKVFEIKRKKKEENMLIFVD